MQYAFFDLETFGIAAARDRISQFAVQRCDEALQPIGDAVVEYCQPADWPLPQPEACLLTGIGPDDARRRGVPEWRFCESLLDALQAPNTCVVGYNSQQFDDVFVQHLCWRNFQDPYAWFWQNGNSRWDILTLARAAFALRPEGLNWPNHPDGSPSLRLEDLAKVNALPQPKAHDALGDVTATIALASALRRAQPKLFDYALGLRDKRRVQDMIEPGEPLVHVSGKVAAALRCLTLWMPVCANPVNRNEWLGLDLRGPVAPWLELDAVDLAERVYARSEDLPEDMERPRMKGVALNRSPFLAPLSTLNDVAAERAELDRTVLLERADQLQRNLPLIAEKLLEISQMHSFDAERDVEAQLYDGFVTAADRKHCEAVLSLPLEELPSLNGRFADNRLQSLLFRYRARHASDTLDAAEQEEWQALSRQQLEFAPAGGLTLAEYFAEIESRAAQANPGDRDMLRQLWAWGQEQAQKYGLGH